MSVIVDSTVQRDIAYTTPRPDVSAMVPRHAQSILDVGCSNGALGASLRQDGTGRRIFGVEIDPAFANVARSRLDHVACADLNAFDWPDFLPGERFDCIIFADVLEHVLDPRFHLAQARNRLSDGGCIVVSLPNIRHVSALASIFWKGTFPARDRGIFDRTHLRWFTISDTKSMISDLKMSVDHMSCALRIGDAGGGRLNRALNKLPASVQRWGWIREFLTYQFCIRMIPCK